MDSVRGFYSLMVSSFNSGNWTLMRDSLKTLYFSREPLFPAQDWINRPPKINHRQDQEKGVATNYQRVLAALSKYFKADPYTDIAWSAHIRTMEAVIQCLDKLNINESSEGVLMDSALIIIILATKRIFYDFMRNSDSPHLQGSMLTSMANTINRINSLRNMALKTRILPPIRIMEASLQYARHCYISAISINLERIKQVCNRDKCKIFLQAKYALMQERFEEAHNLFESIKPTTLSQKRLILRYQIIANLLRGIFFEPQPYRSQEYFPEYLALQNALRRPNFEEFEKVVEFYKKVWLKRGILLLLQRLSLYIWRNLILALIKIEGSKISVQTIHSAAQAIGAKVSYEQTLCLLCNMAVVLQLKCYIHCESGRETLVLRTKK